MSVTLQKVLPSLNYIYIVKPQRKQRITEKTSAYLFVFHKQLRGEGSFRAVGSANQEIIVISHRVFSSQAGMFSPAACVGHVVKAWVIGSACPGLSSNPVRHAAFATNKTVEADRNTCRLSSFFA